MARTPGSKFSLLLLLLAVLPADSHSLHYDFNISSHQHPWCMVHVQLEKGKYLSYDCGSNKVIAMNILREAGKAMDSCKEELGTLSDMGNELKPLLPDIKQEKYADGAPFTLQVRMTCQGKADGGTCGFLEFFLDGQRLLTFDSETEKYRADNSVDEWLKKKLENDKDLTNFFKITLNGDCKILYQCWVHWKTVLETTAAPITVSAPVTTRGTIASASPTKTTDWFQNWTNILMLCGIVPIIICIIGYHYRKRW